MMRRLWTVPALLLSLAVSSACERAMAPAASGSSPAAAPSADAFAAVAGRIDPYVDKNRVVVVTGIANEPDDQMSMVRFLVYANEFDIEGLVAGTSTWMRRM